MQIKTDIDLYEQKTRTRQSEQFAVFEILNQIKEWIKNKGYEDRILRHGSSSILINKIVYYASLNIEKSNPDLQISRGWYKYGPCFDLGRRSEESLSLQMFKQLRPNKKNKIIDEISETCEEHLPIFLESTRRTDFPYDYLSYIYEKKQIHPWLKEYYINKHNLEKMVRKNRKSFSKKEIYNVFQKFDLAITDPNYYRKVEIPDRIIDKIITVNTLLEELYIKSNDLNQDLLEVMKRNLFDSIYMIFAYKNYYKTFNSPNQNFKNIILKSMKDHYEKTIIDLDNKINLYYSNMV